MNNILGKTPGMNMLGGMGQLPGMNLNINFGMNIGTDRSMLSQGCRDPYNGGGLVNSISNMMGCFGNMGMGSIPGFGSSCNPMGSMFGGIMQGLQQQQQMMMMMMAMMMMMMMQQQNQMMNGMGGGMPGMGGGMPGMGGGSGAPGSQGVQGANGANGAAPLNMNGQEAKTAKFIDQYLQKKGSPMAGKGAGEMMVKYAKEYNMDPLILLAIARQETNMGKAGIGINGCLGVGAYDSNPTNALTNPKFAGMENQLRVGAKTFDNLRSKGGSNANASVEQQIAAAGKKWATDPNWAKGVTSIYNQIRSEFQQFQG